MIGGVFEPTTPGFREERLLDETGAEIIVRYSGEPSRERYEFLRDYLEFKLKRMREVPQKITM
jgi:hypothetical protein